MNRIIVPAETNLVGKWTDIMTEFIKEGFTKEAIAEKIGISASTLRKYLNGEYTQKTEKLIAKAFEGVPKGLKRVQMYRYMYMTNLEHVSQDARSTDDFLDRIAESVKDMKVGEAVDYLLGEYKGISLTAIENTLLSSYPDKTAVFRNTYMYQSKNETGMFSDVPEDMTIEDILKNKK